MELDRQLPRFHGIYIVVGRNRQGKKLHIDFEVIFFWTKIHTMEYSPSAERHIVLFCH